MDEERRGKSGKPLNSARFSCQRVFVYQAGGVMTILSDLLAGPIKSDILKVKQSVLGARLGACQAINRKTK